MSLLARIVRLRDESPSDKNTFKSFLPYRKGAKEFDYEAVGSSVLASLIGRHIKNRFSFDNYRKQCLEHLRNKLSDEAVLSDIEKMYFTNDSITKTSPEFMLLRTKAKENASTNHLNKITNSFLAGTTSLIKFNSATNFIEKIFLEILDDNLQDGREEVTESCYLPFVATQFSRDVGLMAKHPDYFLDQLPTCIELYNFIYCSQLGLNIQNWQEGSEPESRPLYFILDTEKASSERSRLRQFGYRSLVRSMANVFPILSMLEYFNKGVKESKEPLWMFARALLAASPHEQNTAKESLLSFANSFREKRALENMGNKLETAIDALAQLFAYAVKQFDSGTSRKRVNDQYTEVFEKEVARNFVQTRGRAGKVLVVNQDFVLLLTNLAIADHKRLRFQEVLCEFRSRGFYFDKKSQQALIKFYERVGNVDRMSDSGDAVYVRKTI